MLASDPVSQLPSNRVLVTGAAGFIGHRLVDDLLTAGADVRAVGRSRDKFHQRKEGIEFFCADLANPDSLKGACTQIDVVYHLAGYAHSTDQDSPLAASLHRQITVEGTRALLEAATEAGVRRFVFLSSVKAMGEGGDICLDETAKEVPTSHYGRSKLEAERLVLEAGRRTGMHVTVLRLPLVYGCGVKGNLRQMIVAIDRGRFPPLPEVGNKRSMVHVDDVANALLLAAQHAAANGQVYIVTDGCAYTTREIYVSICRALGRPVSRWSVPERVLRACARVGDLLELVTGLRAPLTTSALDKLLGSAEYSSSKIHRELGFSPRHTFFESLPEMVRTYKAGLRTQ